MAISASDDARRQIVENLLSDPEIERVTHEEGERRLVEGDEFVDLAHVELGVQQVHPGRAVNPSTVVPRCAVSDETWSRIIHAVAHAPA